MLTNAAGRGLLVAIAAAAFGGAADAQAPADLPGNVVDVEAGEFFFRAPDTIPAGVTTFRLLQIGLVAQRLRDGVEGRALTLDQGDATRGAHMLWVVRLAEGRTVADFHRAAVAGEPTPWATHLGGPAFVLPPGTANATIDLPPGSYALVCFIGSARADRSRSHLLNGMFRAMTVVPSGQGPGVAPEIQIVARIGGDGAVRFSRPLQAGRQTIRVINGTGRRHEFKFVRMRGALSGAEFLAQTPDAGSGIPWGGLSSVPAGGSVTTTIEFAPGEYVVATMPSARHPTSHAFAIDAPAR